MPALDANEALMFTRHGLVVLALGACACTLDERRLLPAADELSSGSSSDFNGQGGDGGGDASTAGNASRGGLVDGCADLDTDGMPDCESTLVQNPTFTSDTDAWSADSNSELAWDPQNALADEPSGSASVSSSSSRASAVQCVPVSGKWLVIAYADAFAVPPDDTDDPPQAGLQVSFFDSDDCSGASSNGFNTPQQTAAGAWTVVQAGNVSSTTTQAISVALVVARKTSADVSAYFDNVMLKTKGL